MYKLKAIFLLLFVSNICIAQDYDFMPYMSMVPESGAKAIVAPSNPTIRPKVVRGKIYNSRWTFPGMPSAQALENHLSGPPHYVSRSKLRAMTDQQLANLHDSLHGNHSHSNKTYSRRLFRWRR